MNNTIYFLRHAETEVDEELPVSQWQLSTRGKLQADMLLKEKAFKKVNIIVTSDEDKAYDTAYPIARKLGKTIDRFKQLNELNRDKSGYMQKEKWNFAVKYGMKNPDKSKAGWEKGSAALRRFTDKIEELDLAYNKRKILVVSHGIVLHMYFANKLGKMQFAFERMMKSKFCDWGTVKNGEVIKELGS